VSPIRFRGRWSWRSSSLRTSIRFSVVLLGREPLVVYSKTLINLELGAKMEQALRASTLSPNRIRKVGAVLLLKDGTEISACNNFPFGVRNIEERHAGDGRLVWMEHAERLAIFEAARLGAATLGSHMTSTLFPCIDCARAIVSAGIQCLDTPAPAFDDPVWGSSFERSHIILEEGGVEIRIVDATASA
jgi:dCMP deaminase